VKQVVPPLISGDRRSGKRPVVVLHIRNKDIHSANQSLDVKEQVGSFFVRDLTVSLVRYMSQYVGDLIVSYLNLRSYLISTIRWSRDAKLTSCSLYSVTRR
jgi:hypothetical protein